MKSPYKGIDRIIHAFQYSWDGLVATFKSESAFRQDLLLCLIAFVLQFFIDVPFVSHVLMVFSLIFIIIAELINTAIETIIDRISPDKNQLSKKAKDIGSAIVMITIISVIVLWIALIYHGYGNHVNSLMNSLF